MLHVTPSLDGPIVDSAVFDDEHLVSCAGLVPVMTLAAQTGLSQLLSDKVTTYTAFTSTKTPITARLVVRRVKDARVADGLFSVWRYHPFFTDIDLPVDQADITHRRHAIIETVFADLINGPLAHMPSGRFGANSAWILGAAIAHNLLRATGVLAGGSHAVARGATLRRRIVNIAARLTRPQRRAVLHLPATGPGPDTGLHCGTTRSDAHPHKP